MTRNNTSVPHPLGRTVPARAASAGRVEMRRTGLFSRARRPRAAGTRRSVRGLCLCLAVTLSLCAITIWARVGPLVRSYGEEMFYHLIVPEWVRWLLEPAPLIVTPREGFEPSTAKDGGGALPTGVERWGDHLITRVSATPNVTLVHDFMTSEECAFVRALGRKMGMVAGTRFPVTNGKLDASAAGLYDYVYGLVRTSVGEYVDYKSLDADDLRRMVAIAKKVEAVTGLAVGNSELPFVQRYEPSARFRAHYDMYNVDVTKPFPYRDNPRSLTLLAYLNDVGDGGGGETEFMLATPRPVRVKAAQGAALIWGNCELEDVAPVEIGSGVKVNPNAGGGGRS